MVDKESIRTIIGIIGNVISFCLFASPMPTIYKIWKKKAVEGFEPDPYLASTLNCIMWVFYGLPFVHPHSLLIVTINGVGLALEIIYVLIFFIFAGNNQKMRKKILVVLLVEVIFFAVIALVTLLCFHTTTKRSLFVGIISVFFNCCMYLSPLLIMRKVIRTKSVKYMPFLLSLTNFLNGVIWVTYALLRFDPFVLTGNGIGSLGGLAQLILYAVYYRSTPRDDEDTGGNKLMGPPVVELSTRQTI
ncbi:bidirectional sugar transporter SWEET5-like [Macadamia integrifolia]|uniref:bidirectional sugar transporter SWEET5-like n=1 Tax=Macadamia integrifolia TaxID=60698 RepID=UPI001C4E9BFA|nr:bidirectional sugar transporter SWEET5-like [Macadamia integrifolia]